MGIVTFTKALKALDRSSKQVQKEGRKLIASKKKARKKK